MIQQPRTPSTEERIEFKRGELQAVRNLMCNHDIETIKADLLAQIEKAVLGVFWPDPHRDVHERLRYRDAVIAAICGVESP